MNIIECKDNFKKCFSIHFLGIKYKLIQETIYWIFTFFNEFNVNWNSCAVCMTVFSCSEKSRDAKIGDDCCAEHSPISISLYNPSQEKPPKSWV